MQITAGVTLWEKVIPKIDREKNEIVKDVKNMCR